jgi:hypothetical protein
MRLFRGINPKYRDCPFVPSALRPASIKFIEDEVNNWLHIKNKQFKFRH